jgi:ABC-type glycerol-3-phosphate transport system substrate-binding protein
MRRLATLALAALFVAGCGDGTTKTVTETRTVTVATAAPAPPTGDREAILDATEAFYAASGTGINRRDLTLQKTDGRFADVLVAQDAHAILKKGGETWIVVFDGNGTIPPATRERFGIPAEYGG